MRQWPLEVPIGGKPADNVAVVEAYRDWLTGTEVPKLMFAAHPGGIIDDRVARWCRDNLPNLEEVDIGDGIHFVQEDAPDLIGAELARWFATI